MLRQSILVCVLVSSACGLGVAPALRGPALRGAAHGRAPTATMQLWAGKKRSRYEDDGSRLQGADLNVDDQLKGGWFSDFKWGTEVEVVDTTKKPQKKKNQQQRGDGKKPGRGAATGAYTNVESARFSGLESQQIRKRNLEAYINSEEEASDGTFGKIISGSALVSIFAGLIGVYIYYGGDGLLAATAKQRSLSGLDGGSRQAGDEVCMTTDCMTQEPSTTN